MAGEDHDGFSSPDPLNDSLDSSFTRRITRSQQTQKFVSLGASSSPRKQTFELEVGDNKSPQKLYVTVESGQQATKTARRLFTSSSPTPVIQRRVRTTTTTVPLKGIAEDDTVNTDASLVATPRKRGRPRKNETTPKATTTRKRSKTPIRKTPKPKGKAAQEIPSEASSEPTPNATRTRRTKKSADDTASEASVAATPKATRTKRTTKRKAVEDDTGSVSQASSRKRGRGRREALMPDEFANLADAEMADAPTEEDAQSVEAPFEREPSLAESANQDAPESEGDVWLNTLSDQATPKPTRARTARTLSSIIRRETSMVEEEAALDLGGYADLGDAASDSDSRASRETTQQPESDIEDMHAALGTTTGAASDILSEADRGEPNSAAKDRDTIMQSEDFSMILMDSYPSIHDTSAALAPVGEANEEEELGEEASLVINRTIESIRQGMDSDKPEEGEQQGQQQQEQRHEHQQENDKEASEDNEFANGHVSPETPQVIQLSPTRTNASPRSGSPRRMKAMPLSRQLLTFKAIQAEQARNAGSPRPAKFSPGRSSMGLNEENSNLYEDSFSEIPEAVLEAATPRRPRSNMLDIEDEQQEQLGDAEDEQVVEGEEESQPTPKMMATVVSNAGEGFARSTRSESGRLLTPDDTPSPVDSDIEQEDGKEAAESSVMEVDQNQDQQSIESRVSSSLPRSSIDGQSVNEPQIETNKVTPAWPVSSPQLPALQDTNMLYPGNSQEREPRRALSPIVRAGRALQSVTSDNSSPLGRRSTLGSPFRSSSTSGSRMGAKQNFTESVHQPESLVASMAQIQQPTFPQSEDDPFGTSKGQNGQTSFMKALDQTLRNSTQDRQSTSRASVASSTRVTPPEEDEMSWVPTQAINVAQTTKTDSRNSSLVATLGSIANKQRAFEMDGADDENIDDDFEDDPFLAEAQRPTPRQPHQQSFGRNNKQQQQPQPQPQPNPAPRRTQIPNTWRRTSRLISVENSNKGAKGHNDSAMEEYSFVSQQNKVPGVPTVPQKDFQFKQRLGGGLDLSSFFSSPAALPPAAGTEAALKNAPASTSQAKPAPSVAAPLTATNSMFPPVPQKQFQPSPARRRRNDLFSPAAKVADVELFEDTTAEQAAPSTPEDIIVVPAIQQKQNFTPRPRQAGQSTPLFSKFKSPATQSVAPTPPQMQLSRDDIEKWQEETSAILEDSDGSPDAIMPPPRHRTMSPTKSCLRSPLKPHTPGRVVEFASSVLSPLQQAQARMQKVINAPSLQPRVRVPAPAPAPAPAPVQPSRATVTVSPEEEDKENTPQNEPPKISKPTKPATKQPSTIPPPLSQTTWSRDHWLLLDKFLQLRQQGPFAFVLPRTKSTALLGKVASAQGVDMALEQWHLDVVDAFKYEVGGWDEGILAKRLFALIVGEQKRRAAKRNELVRNQNQNQMGSRGGATVAFH